MNTGSKEANKEVAKDNNADISTRLSAGKDAIGDKVDVSKPYSIITSSEHH